MKISGKEIADSILFKLKKKIKERKLTPHLAIVLAGDNPSSIIYVNNKIKAAQSIGIEATPFKFSKDEKEKCLQTISKLNNDPKVDGIIVQYPVYDDWNFDDFALKVDPQKDVDGFSEDSPYRGATALAVWEMLSAFAKKGGFKETKDFLMGKKIAVLGKGKTAGGPIIKLLKEKGLEINIIDSKTLNPDQITKKADVVISATGKKNIINGSNIKKGSYVVGVGLTKEETEGKTKVYGDVNEEEVSKIAKLYSPTIGGIGPLTVVCLLKNVVQSSQRKD